MPCYHPQHLFCRTRDFITALDDSGIIVVRELQSTESYEELDGIACMLVDMLNTEAMTSAWVSYSNVADDIMELSDAYKEARTALEVGKIFYADKNVFGYNRLGIGRLIYQLPTQVCNMFVGEIFGEESLESIDDETLNIIRTFFENNLNLSETSRQLYVHRNTLVYRFEKLQKRFGLDIRTFEDALAFKLAMMVSDYNHLFRKSTENKLLSAKIHQKMQVHKKSRKQQIMSVRGFFISAASDAPVEDTDIPEDLYPDPP